MTAVIRHRRLASLELSLDLMHPSNCVDEVGLSSRPALFWPSRREFTFGKRKFSGPVLLVGLIGTVLLKLCDVSIQVLFLGS